MASRGWIAGGKALGRVKAALTLMLAAPAAAASTDRWNAQIEEASRRFGMPEDWIRRVIQAESGGRTTLNGEPIISRAGAMGLMQLMPGTWAEMRRAQGLGPDPHDPRDNVLAGTAYLRAMYDRFGYPGLFAAYNAGPARYSAHLATGRPLPSETIAYMATATERAANPGQVRRQPDSPSPLFAVFRARGQSAAAAGSPVPQLSDALFVRLGRAPR